MWIKERTRERKAIGAKRMRRKRQCTVWSIKKSGKEVRGDDREQYYARRVLFAACGLVNPLARMVLFSLIFLTPSALHISFVLLYLPSTSHTDFVVSLPLFQLNSLPPWVQNLLSTSTTRFVNTNCSVQMSETYLTFSKLLLFPYSPHPFSLLPL